MISRALDIMPLPRGGVLFIENVGNLVCPAGFDLGEAHKVVIGSVTEGEDKPLKYPGMFAASSLMLVSKVDLAPHCDVDVAGFIANARRVNPTIAAIATSARTGQGLDAWLAWIDAARAFRAAAE
jgi:hydrogenase nickel incorporation protein HypB